MYRLQGVTGSGKTLVYFERIKEIIKTKTGFSLLPEIFLTNQFKDRFKNILVMSHQYGTQNYTKK